jgi:hypothetical protein|tara:strand:+ start:3287 stop:3622 length:336 start_codon:yes stop_codon:yes gene_type:complete
MGDLLDGFVSLMEGDEDKLSIAELLSDKEVDDWELLVKCYSELNITSIGKDLKRISKFYNLERWQEISILSLIKMMELMVKEAEENGMKTPIDADSLRSPMNKEYSGGMFG